jgi:hypothetical protein
MKRSTYYILDQQDQIVFCSKLKTEVKKFLVDTKKNRDRIITKLLFNNLTIHVTQ